MDLEQKVMLFQGWVEREEQTLESEVRANMEQGNTQMINYCNGKLYELKLIKELMPRK